MSKKNIFNKAVTICNKVQEKINSGDWIVLFENQLLEKSNDFIPKFVFDFDLLGISFQEEKNVFIEIIADNDFEDTFKNIKEMKTYFAKDFSFIKKSNIKNVFGRKLTK